MDTNLEAYKIWSPDNAPWSPWVKPVLFSRMPATKPRALNTPDMSWMPPPDHRTALIIDVPGADSALEGIALAQLGYRPVPLYNGVCGPNKASMIVDVTDIVMALFQGAQQLEALSIRSDASPAFLLDSNRMKGIARQPGKYDNRWCVFPQDMPSASYLAEQGIQQIYIRTDFLQNDLTHILQRYKERGIRLYRIASRGALKEITSIVRPSYFQSLSYRMRTMMGLVKNAAGGFGGIVPEATQSSGGRYYGIG